MRNDLVIGMAGAGGDGIISAGEALINGAAKEGYHAIMTKSFGSQIRGGESSCRFRVSTGPIWNSVGMLDVAVVLNWPDFLQFGGELPTNGRTVVLYEEASGVEPGDLPLKGVQPEVAKAVPITALAEQEAGTARAKNVVVLGLLAGWFDLGRKTALAGLRKKFSAKGDEVVEANERAFLAGVKYAEEHPLPEDARLAPLDEERTMLLADGNAFAAAAALHAGCRFFSGYPITPSTEVMQWLSKEIWKVGGSLLQAEDEIAGIGAALGGSFAGIKSMTATSGPGLSLKTEILGLATIAELPLVIVNVQRGGPSTGLPTKSEQSDLLTSVFSAHGDVIRPVLASINVADTFPVTVEAFNIAEHYQTPVIVLTDQDIAQRKETVEPFDPGTLKIESRRAPGPTERDPYQRFRMTSSGISPLSWPGMEGGNYLASGIEHTETGAPTASGEVHARMNEKRFHKFHSLVNREDLFLRSGDVTDPLGVISWGSTAGVALEAVRAARAEGIQVKLLVPKLLYPISDEIYSDFFESLDRVLVVEQNHQGQLLQLIRMAVDIPCSVEIFCRSGANPIAPEELHERLRELVHLYQGEDAPVPFGT